jgi:cytochrome c-type biogenesis protein CcmE
MDTGDTSEPSKSTSQTEDDGLVRRRETAPKPQAGKSSIWLVVALVTGGAVVVALVLGGMKDNSTYAKRVDDLIREKTRFVGRSVSAQGSLVHGTLVKRDSPCEYRFTIEKNGVSVPVRFGQCVVPDSFRDVAGMDVDVTVVGKLLADNSFEANSIVTKCPSKYEMEQRKKRGETMPHAAVQGPAAPLPPM